MTYAVRRKSNKGHGKQGQRDAQGKQPKTADTSNPAEGSHDFVNEYRMKELSQRRGPHGLDIDGIR